MDESVPSCRYGCTTGDLVKRLALAIGILFVALATGCGGGGVSISISPTTATVPPGQTQQLTANVSNGSNSSVTWQVNSVVGGNSTDGTITTAGLYTAPTTIPGSGTVTITAVPAADTTKTATATVTIANPISVSPANVLVAVNATQQFTASVTFSTNTAVNWQVNGVAGGNSTYGTIGTGGLYTAPSSVPSSPSVTITAISQADTTKTATATVQITPPTLVIAPTSLTLAAGSQQVFTATSLQQPVKPNWSVTCASQTATDCGIITSDGVYNAPLAPPPGGTVVVSANMADGSALPANTTVTIQISNAILDGTYVFGVTSDAISGFSAEAGVITLDGTGNIVGGTLDQSGTGAGPITITGGTYSIGSDGRGTALLQTSQGSIAWQMAVATNAKTYLARLTANGVTAMGTMELQQASATANITGAYALNLAGVTTANPASAFMMVGSLTTDGTTTVTRAVLDAATNAGVSANLAGTGTYTAPSTTGRGTLAFSSTFGSQTFTYYQVDSTHAKLVETDGVQLSGGELYRQSAGPFSASTFNENLAFTLTGFKSGAVYGIGGVFTLNGSSGITNRLIDGVSQTVFDTNGAYLVTDAASGRTTATWTVGNGVASQYVLYPRSDGGFVMLETDGVSVASGLTRQQTLTSPSVFSLAGNLALGMTGYESSASFPEVLTGVLAITHQGALSGILDTADSSGVTVRSVLQIGSFTVALTNGRGVVTVLSSSPSLANGSVIIYILDANNALIFESDGNRILTGTIARQF
jgi:hypothetical protein